MPARLLPRAAAVGEDAVVGPAAKAVRKAADPIVRVLPPANHAGPVAVADVRR